MSLSVEFKGRTLSLHQGDITHQEMDVIVNAANSSLMGGGGVDGAIHRAGGPAIKRECKTIVSRKGRLKTGGAVTTGAGELSATHVIHTVGPVYRGTPRDTNLLRSAYTQSLKRADEAEAESVAFPSISTGAYGYPLEEASRIALEVVSLTLPKLRYVRHVRFVLFDADTYRAYEKALKKLT